MTLSELKNHLEQINTIEIQLPNGSLLPPHFHVTEIGQLARKFIDCGGTIREKVSINIQLWQADDFDHRLHPKKLISIIILSQKTLNLPDAPIEVEFQGQTIEKYGLEYNGHYFTLTNTHTDCLAQDSCGIPPEKLKQNISEVAKNTCVPGSGCC